MPRRQGYNLYNTTGPPRHYHTAHGKYKIDGYQELGLFWRRELNETSGRRAKGYSVEFNNRAYFVVE